MTALPDRVRERFPLLSSCVYLNSNSTGAVPRETRDVLDHYWATMTHWRDEVWEGWWERLWGHADQVARFIGAPPGSVALDANLSTLLGRFLTCIDFQGPRRRIVTTDLEFPTVPFIAKAFERYGAETITVPSDGCRIDEEALTRHIDERTAVVCVSHVTFATGALLDVRRVADHAHEHGALVVIDAYQSIGTAPVDVEALDADVVLGGAHKWLCGSIESAFMYVRPSLIPGLEPAATGWIASLNPFSFAAQSEYAGNARRFSSGTPQVLPVLMSEPALSLIGDVGIEAIRAHSLGLTERVIARADDLRIEVLTPRGADERGGVVALRFRDDERVAKELVQRGYICSYRGALRVAPHFYNTDEEVDSFMSALAEIRSER